MSISQDSILWVVDYKVQKNALILIKESYSIPEASSINPDNRKFLIQGLQQAI